MSVDSCVILSIPEPHVALVTINRPDARNAVDSEVAAEIGRLVRALEADPGVWCVVLTGVGGKVFCAGADLKVISAGLIHTLFPPEGGFAGFVEAKRTKPWIAAVDGLALAGGCELALACDMIVASEDAAFGLPEVTRGLVASAGGAFRLARVLPRPIAIELIATGSRLDATRALSLGMVNHVVPKRDVVSRALQLAGEIAANAPVAVRESLAITRQSLDLDDTTLMQLSAQAQARVMKTDDFQEGPLAFIQKRSPRWVGH